MSIGELDHEAMRRALNPPGRASGWTRLADRMRSLATWRVWIPGAVFFVVFAAIFFASAASFSIPTVESLCGAAPLDVRLFSDAGDVQQFLDGCGGAGRDAYRNMQIADLFYPFVMGLYLASSLAMVLSRFTSRPDLVALAALPFLGSAFDYLENLFVWIALGAFPDEPITNSALGFASAAKTTVFWISGVILLGALVVLVVTGVTRRTTNRRRGSTPVGGSGA